MTHVGAHQLLQVISTSAGAPGEVMTTGEVGEFTLPSPPWWLPHHVLAAWCHLWMPTVFQATTLMAKVLGEPGVRSLRTLVMRGVAWESIGIC